MYVGYTKFAYSHNIDQDSIGLSPYLDTGSQLYSQTALHLMYEANLFDTKGN